MTKIIPLHLVYGNSFSYSVQYVLDSLKEDKDIKQVEDDLESVEEPLIEKVQFKRPVGKYAKSFHTYTYTTDCSYFLAQQLLFAHCY